MITDETLFKRMLSLERRRCERTGTQFALLLLEMDDLVDVLSPTDLENMGLAVSGAMRETDVTGWYRQPSTLGVILTALNGAERQILEPVIMERTRKALSHYLSDDQIKRIWVSCHLFPEDTGSSSGGGGELERMLYSDEDKADSNEKNSTKPKRLFDIVMSSLALILLSPLLLLIALLVKLTSPGPVLFRQPRVGQYGRQFTFLKFRSMYVGNDSSIHQEYVRNLINKKLDQQDGSFKIKNDPRITAIGKILRKSSLDELPQFINVLKGDMSLVGPRPPIPYEFENYALWHRRRILEGKPGITGLWQVDGRSRTSFDEMVRMDLRYIRHQSLWLDVKILLKTPRAVLSGDGAY